MLSTRMVQTGNLVISSTNYLLLETGTDHLLLESGGKIVISVTTS